MPQDNTEVEIEKLRKHLIWHNAISLKAYRLWQREGSPNGAMPDGQPWAEHFWLRAEAQFRENGFS